MNQFNRKLSEFFAGRNGVDQLGRAMMISACVLIMIGIFSRQVVINWIADVLILVSIYRMLSSKVSDRRRENDAYLRFLAGIRMRFTQRGEYRFFVCKNCGKKLRVPKGKGKVEITCPQCRNKMIKRT